jgi:hypothetical protein
MAASSAGVAAAAASLLGGPGSSAAGSGAGGGLHAHPHHHHHVACSCPHISLPPAKKASAQMLLAAAAAAAAAGATDPQQQQQQQQQQQRGMKRPRPGTPLQPSHPPQHQGPAAAAVAQTALLRRQALTTYRRLLEEGRQGGVPMLPSGVGKGGRRQRRRALAEQPQQDGRAIAPFTRSAALGAVEGAASEVRCCFEGLGDRWMNGLIGGLIGPLHV